MKRDIDALAEREFDVVIIGGGINGVSCAWDAALRGLDVAVLERDDFGGATSSNSAKIAHCGMRYLQHLDIARMRESIRERNSLISRAPHLVDNQPFVLPVYGHGVKGRETMAVYLKVFDLLSLERKRFSDPARRVPDSKIVSRQEAMALLPDASPEGLTCAALWYEGQIHNTERLLLSILRSAAERGARCANYVEVKRIAVSGDSVTAVEAIDRMSGKEFAIRTKSIINATGPWLDKTLALTGLKSATPCVHGSKAFSLLTRPLTDSHAISFGIRPMYRDRQAVIDKGTSIQFAIPWRGNTLIGSLHLACSDDPEQVTISEDEIDTYIERINEGLPSARLTRQDVKRVLWGMVPADEAGSAAPKKHYSIVDHAERDSLNGIISIAGVKLTTSRHVAKNAVDRICAMLGRPGSPCQTKDARIWGGEIEFIEELRKQVLSELSELSSMPQEVALRLLRTYGSEYRSVLASVPTHDGGMQMLPGSTILRAEVIHAIRDEMALTLEDVVLRRTDLGSLQFPGDEAIESVAGIMACELGWNEQRVADEIDHVRQLYASSGELRLRAAPTPGRL
jgi:glycerol-3-phosphate dehydrogenase